MSIQTPRPEGHSGAIVRAKRTELGLTMQQVADRLGVQVKTVHLAETRRSWRGMRIGVCFDLCTLLDLELAEVYAAAGVHWSDRMDMLECEYVNHQADLERKVA